MSKKALYYKKLDNKNVRCELCPHFCKIADGEVGKCGVRYNDGGTLTSLVYEHAIASHVDPIEKKPLFHVFPGSRSFSIATVGCNFFCKFCQNYDISQVRPRDHLNVPGRHFSVEEVVRTAKQNRCKTIACTYTEPTIFYEYALDIAKRAQEEDIHTVLISNGYISEAPIDEIAPYIMAANIDLKSWDDGFYRDWVDGKLESVLKALKRYKARGVWLEVTTLLIPELVDKEDDLKQIAEFIGSELGEETPWHISRFFPHYQSLDLSPTSVESLKRARQIALDAGLHYVYSGNLPGDDGESTYCYQCGEKIISRYGFEVSENKVSESTCPACGAKIDGVGF